MKKFIFLFLCFGITTTFLGQDLNSYKYVKVPVKYDFLKQENQYQLNALTAFLFEKKGFKVLYRDIIPQGIEPCDVLQSDVHSDSGLFRSRLFFTLKNCKNEIVFTSETGMSREKEFKDSYHEALRDAFNSLEQAAPEKSVAKNEIAVIDPVPTSEEIEALEEQPKGIIVDPVVTAKEIESLPPKEGSSAEEKATVGASEGKIYTNGTVKYSLAKTPSGFELFREGSNEKFAILLKSGSGDNYIYASKNVSGNAFFDTSGNLVVECLDPNSEQLVSVAYKLQAQ